MMRNALFAKEAKPESSGTSFGIWTVILAWLALIIWLGARQTFVLPQGTPPLPVLLAVVMPVLLFMAAYRISAPFREFVLSSDLRFITALQSWRIGGFLFLVLYKYGILPGYFAWPAGSGDMAIGITAPWILMELVHRKNFAAGKAFRLWNIFGIVDLVVAVSMGGLGSRFFSGSSISSTAPMAHLPLVLIPGFLVPIFIILHCIALIQARHIDG